MWWIITSMSMPIVMAVQKETPMSHERATACPSDTKRPRIVSAMPAIPTPSALPEQAQDFVVDSEERAAGAVAA